MLRLTSYPWPTTSSIAERTASRADSDSHLHSEWSWDTGTLRTWVEGTDTAQGRGFRSSRTAEDATNSSPPARDALLMLIGMGLRPGACDDQVGINAQNWWWTVDAIGHARRTVVGSPQAGEDSSTSTPCGPWTYATTEPQSVAVGSSRSSPPRDRTAAASARASSQVVCSRVPPCGVTAASTSAPRCSAMC